MEPFDTLDEPTITATLTPPPRQNVRGKVILIGSIATVVVLIGFWVFYLGSPLKATVTITPIHQEVSGQYKFNVITHGPAVPGDLIGRLVSFTSPTQSQTTSATGSAHIPAQSAIGYLVFSGIQLYSSVPNQYLPSNLAFYANNGSIIVTDEKITLNTGVNRQSLSHAQQAGPGGNIGAYAVNGDYDIVPVGATASTPAVGRMHVSNPSSFSGGANARDVTEVTQSDIDSVSVKLTNQTRATAQQAVQQQAKQSLLPTEALLDTAPACTPKVSSDSLAGDVATSVTVSVTTTCTLIAYPIADFTKVLKAQQSADASKAMSNGFEYPIGGPSIIATIGLVGDIVYDTPTGITNSDGNGTLFVSAKGEWSYLFDAASQHDIVAYINGKTPDNAKKFITDQIGVQNVALKATGFGYALSRRSSDITIVIVAVTGLKATI